LIILDKLGYEAIQAEEVRLLPQPSAITHPNTTTKYRYMQEA
jgi:hypothetical protein